MRYLACLLALCVFSVGCEAPEEEFIPTVTPKLDSGTTGSGTTTSGTTTSGTTGAHEDHGDHEGHADHADGEEHGDHEGHSEADHDVDGDASATKSGMIRFVSDQSMRVDNMMCPFSCWPRVKETLETQAGVEAVQLAEQPAGTEEGTIAEPVVELKLSEGFDPAAAVAALASIDFEAELIQ